MDDTSSTDYAMHDAISPASKFEQEYNKIVNNPDEYKKIDTRDLKNNPKLYYTRYKIINAQYQDSDNSTFVIIVYTRKEAKIREPANPISITYSDNNEQNADEAIKIIFTDSSGRPHRKQEPAIIPKYGKVKYAESGESPSYQQSKNKAMGVYPITENISKERWKLLAGIKKEIL